MHVRYYEDEKFINAELFRDSDGSVFQSIANELSAVFNIRWITKIDGLDQRYWDFEFKGTILILHLEHYLGISIYVQKSEMDIESARQILGKIGYHFKSWDPEG